jgi:hypothetical protein
MGTAVQRHVGQEALVPGPHWLNVVELIELARRAEAPEWTPERRDRLYQRVVVRAAKERARRRAFRAVTAGLAALLLVGFVVRSAYATA